MGAADAGGLEGGRGRAWLDAVLARVGGRAAGQSLALAGQALPIDRPYDGVDQRKSVGFGRLGEKYHRQTDAADVFAHRVRGSGSDCSRF